MLDALVQHARVEKLVEVRGASGTGIAGYRYVLTDLGRDRASSSSTSAATSAPRRCRWRSTTPTCAPAWRRGRGSTATPSRGGFEHLVVNNGDVRQLGPAVNSGKSLFLYGAPGNGKTVVAEGIGRALGSDMHVPHAIDVDGQTITMYDPVSHERIEPGQGARRASSPRRFTIAAGKPIRRPVVVVGGELTLEMLDLTFNPIAKFYEAPIQMKANGGVFVVDDFGRQRIPPRDLLNRWIVPLESRVDFLTLHTGRKFEIPFNVFIIFATNLKPESLADEAFLRRIPYKILRAESDDRRVLPHLRDELPQARADVRPGDGRVPAAQVLRAAASSRCAPATPAIWLSRSSTCAAISSASL